MKKKLMRFMGVNELAAFLAGQELENHTDWRKRAQSTDSKGFCFLICQSRRKNGSSTWPASSIVRSSPCSR